ncbi:MAG: DnaJ domain-containing protein [Candidatus Rifleibacteriota bacterium]
MNKTDEFQKYYEEINPEELENFLRTQNQPIWESELLHSLFPELNLVNGSAIEMYRWHFVLFNHLYKLQQKLLQKATYLHIHFMNLFIIDFPQGNKCCHYYSDSASFCEQETVCNKTRLCAFHLKKSDDSSLDKLSESYFYLDPENFHAVSPQNAEAFIAGAWNLLMNYQDLVECYKILELPQTSDLKLIKKHFKNLAKRYHPDLNPDYNNDFARINSAYRRLTGYLKTRQMN